MFHVYAQGVDELVINVHHYYYYYYYYYWSVTGGVPRVLVCNRLSRVLVCNRLSRVLVCNRWCTTCVGL